jgi:hypothetical protein
MRSGAISATASNPTAASMVCAGCASARTSREAKEGTSV